MGRKNRFAPFEMTVRRGWLALTVGGILAGAGVLLISLPVMAVRRYKEYKTGVEKTGDVEIEMSWRKE
jgi:hypothetical protein